MPKEKKTKKDKQKTQTIKCSTKNKKYMYKHSVIFVIYLTNISISNDNGLVISTANKPTCSTYEQAPPTT